MTGRPSTYTDEIANYICEQIAEGRGLRAICREDSMPGRQTILDWLNNDSDPRFAAFRAKYARAREAQGDFLDEQMQDVADAARPEDVQVARLKIDTMKWRAAKLAPKKYGDSTTIKGDPENPLPPAAVNLTVTSDLVKTVIQQVRDEF